MERLNSGGLSLNLMLSKVFSELRLLKFNQVVKCYLPDNLQCIYDVPLQCIYDVPLNNEG